VAEWYRDVLELPIEERDQGFSCVLGQTHFAIHRLQEGQSATRDAELGISVPDVDAFAQRLIRKNIELADPVRDYPWARAAQIRDPLGNVVYLMQLPASSLEELG
jgi:predicted enzyme related to lactoylglutathione lyase